MSLRIRIVTYSTKPRGGVVHAMRLSEELAARGHDVSLWAVSVDGRRFFREPSVEARLVAVPGREESIDDRVARYADALAEALAADGRADIDHAEDCLSARALLDLRSRGLVAEVVRTIHHVDDFTSPFLADCQRASIADVDHRICVSRHWADAVRRDFAVEATVIANGVDAERFGACPLDRPEAARRFGWAGRTAILAVGGVEPRKGSVDLLRAFAGARGRLPGAPLLVVAGGETLFDYADYRDAWAVEAARLGLRVHRGPAPPADADVAVIGPVADAEMPALYRAADVFAFPSHREGFGLVVLEAQAAGVPTVTSDLPVFAEFLTAGRDTLSIPVGDAARLADALVVATSDTGLRDRLVRAGRDTARRFSWQACAEQHESTYGRIVGARRA